MRRTRPHTSLLALLATAFALTLAACGGDDAPSGSASGSDGAGGTSQQTSGDVEEQLGFSQSGIIARQSRVEAAIRDCMRNEGFEYIPIDPVAQRAAILGSGRLSDEDFLQQFGYGISTLWGRGGGAQADPNVRVRAAMGTADGRAYDRALWGENKGATFTEAVDSGDFSRLGGCTKESTERIFGGSQVLTKLIGRLDQLEERMLQDQRMVRAIERWSGCMGAAGYRYDEPEAIDTDLLARMEAIVGPNPGQFATGPAAGERPQPFDRAALATLQREEVATARSDFACETKHIVPVEEKVAPQYQARFREQNRDLISQVKPVR